MSDERCKHEMIMDFCSLCRPIPIIEPGRLDDLDEPSDGRWFEAKYRDECVNCGTPFGPGATIRAHPEADGLYECRDCCGVPE